MKFCLPLFLIVIGGATAFAVAVSPTAVARDGTAVAMPEVPGPWAHPDAARISLWSEAAGVPAVFSLAIAWRETRNNPSPYSTSVVGARGRFQIMRATARARCPHLDTETPDGNLACFLKLTRENLARCGGSFWCAAKMHNGSGRAAEQFADSVMASVRQLVEREIDR